MTRISRLLKRQKRRRLSRTPGDPAWMFIMERVAERANKHRPHRIYQGKFPWAMPPRLDDRGATLVSACLREETARLLNKES